MLKFAKVEKVLKGVEKPKSSEDDIILPLIHLYDRRHESLEVDRSVMNALGFCFLHLDSRTHHSSHFLIRFASHQNPESAETNPRRMRKKSCRRKRQKTSWRTVELVQRNLRPDGKTRRPYGKVRSPKGEKPPQSVSHLRRQGRRGGIAMLSTTVGRS